MALLKQKSSESLMAYGERAFRLRQMLEPSDEPYLVQRFRKGLCDKSIWRLLASHKSGGKQVTIQDLNAQIISICEDDQDSSSDSDEEPNSAASSDSSSEEDSDSSAKRNSRKLKKTEKKKDKSKAKSRKVLRDSELSRLNEYEERLKRIEEGANQVDSFHVGNYQQGPGGYQGRQGSSGGYRNYNQGRSGQGYQRGYQGGQGNDGIPIMCFNCGKDGHMARFCREF